MKEKHPLLEVCCGSMTSVDNALAGGAERIELCSALGVGGLTPSLGLLREARKHYPALTIHVLIRPREGDFNYSSGEMEVLMEDVRLAVENGADGIVCGILDKNGEIDIVRTGQVIAASGGRQFTFHRAFDAVTDPISSLETLVSLGCHRVLTSGGAETAVEGADMLKKLVRAADGRIIVMPGAGVKSSNVAHLMRNTGCTEVHASCARALAPAMRGPALGVADDGSRTETDANEVAAVIAALREFRI